MSSKDTGAVVKANAYGLGLTQVAKALYDEGARIFFVATAEEGAELRSSLGKTLEIYVFSGHMIGDTDLIKKADVYTGGFGAEYGGRISSIMDIKTKDGNKKRFGGKITSNTFGSKLLLEEYIHRLN